MKLQNILSAFALVSMAQAAPTQVEEASSVHPVRFSSRNTEELN
jgi:hypothetical protein